MPDRITRLAVHIFSGVLVAFAPVLFAERWWPVAVSLGLLFLLLMSIRFGWLPSIHTARPASYGTVWFALSAFTLFLLAWNQPMLITIPLLVMAFGDAAGVIVGETRRRARPLPPGLEGKSWDGSIAVFGVTGLTVSLGWEAFGMAGPGEAILAGRVCGLVAAMVVVFAVSNRIAESIIASPQINPHGLNAQLIRIVSKLTSLVVATVLFLIGGQYLGIPVATLLASAGIGGLAIAFGAQDTLKTLFGTLMLMGDKPFRVGERIIFNEYDGVVEDIGLRSTKIRLLTGHQVTIPNDELARSDIENVGRRPHIRKIADIHIPLDTPRERLEKAIEIIRAALDNHEGMDPEFPPRIFFTDFNPTAFNIRVIYWYNPPKYWDFLAFSERVNLDIFRAFEEQGIQFSLPLRVTHTSIESKAKPVEVEIVKGDR